MSSLPPLLRLPNELLVEIFSNSDNKQVPLVCCDFRDIIYSTPSFWTFVYIGPKQHTPGSAAFLSKRLERGATCPLDVVVRAAEPAVALAIQLWKRLSICRNRIRSLDIGADTWVLCGQILRTILLTPPATPSYPFLHKLDIRHENDLRVPFQRGLMDPHTLLRPIATLFPALTVLVLPFMVSCIPFPDGPIFSLKTLILDGSMSWRCHYPQIHHIAQLLVRAPNLETFWCKEHRVFTFIDPSRLNSLPTYTDRWGFPEVHFPVSLSRLTKMSVVVPGLGIDLLHAINAHALEDLHFDGIRNDDWYDAEVAWLDWFPPTLRTGLQVAASRSPELRRLSLVGAYLSRDTWEWLLGCSASTWDLPFPLLESIAVHQMKAVKDQVTNVVDDALIELYAQRGQLKLLRFAYLASEPPLGSVALQQLINSASERRRPGQVFELELDGAYDLDVNDGVRLILHDSEERPQRKIWWTLGKDIDPTEDDSY